MCSSDLLVEEISAEALREKCLDCMEITVSDTETYAAVLEKAYPLEKYKVLPDHVIRIYAPKQPAEAYSRLAMENQIDIISMQSIQSSLENYYIGLKDGRIKK